MKKISDELLKKIAGGAIASTMAPKYKIEDQVKSISHPELGNGVIIDVGALDGAIAYAVCFKDDALVLPEVDLVLVS